MNSLKKYLGTSLFLYVIMPVLVGAQGTLFVSPSLGSYRVGESFSILVNVNTGGDSINASAGQINFDNSKLEVVSLGYSQSIFSLWTENPSFSNPAGSIIFSGGVPSPGFSGASGGIMRVTFKVKAPGQAPVNFLTGSILANDGKGTNIADILKGALYTLTPSANFVAEPTVNTKNTNLVPADKPISTPEITKWPKQLNESESLTVEGLGYPLTKISIIIQKDAGELINGHTFSGFDGKFKFTYGEKVQSGYYSIWARNVAEDGNQSGLSDVVNIEVVAPSFVRIGGLILNYASIIVTLLSLLIFVILLVLLSLVYYGRKKKKQGDELSEAEDVLHQSFETMKDGMSNYVTYLTSSKSVSDMRKREQKTKDELIEELENIESKITKEIKDIN